LRNLLLGKKPNHINVKLGEYEYAMLQGLVNHWQCTTSEAVRRAIVYTYSKFVHGGVGLSEEELNKALEIALSNLKHKYVLQH